MNSCRHNAAQLFKQLGLADDALSMGLFIHANTPLSGHVDIADAWFWTAPQAAFLREELLADADWSGVIDQLSNALRSSFHPRTVFSIAQTGEAI